MKIEKLQLDNSPELNKCYRICDSVTELIGQQVFVVQKRTRPILTINKSGRLKNQLPPAE